MIMKFPLIALLSQLFRIFLSNTKLLLYFYLFIIFFIYLFLLKTYSAMGCFVSSFSCLFTSFSCIIQKKFYVSAETKSCRSSSTLVLSDFMLVAGYTQV